MSVPGIATDAEADDGLLLDVRGLRTEFHIESGPIVVSNEVSFSLDRGKTMGLVGEPGTGKSVMRRSFMRLIDSPGEITGRQVVFDGEDLLQKTEAEMRDTRGNRIAMIPQDPMSSLNPVIAVGEQITETIRRHQDVSKSETRQLVVESMDDVGIPGAEERIGDYPYEFSGEMRQRVLAAIGFSYEPDLIIVDEPTTALDVMTQAKILDLLNEMQGREGVAILMIIYNLGVVAQTYDYVGVMYAGNLVETAELGDLFDRPRHPYTRSLIDSIPEVDTDYDELLMLDGAMSDLGNLPSGCNFVPWCPHATEACRTGGDPPLDPVGDGLSYVACLHVDDPDLSESTVPKAGAGRRDIDRTGKPLFEVRNLKKCFDAGGGILGNVHFSQGGDGLPTVERWHTKAIDDMNSDAYPDETVGFVGESGCGKSMVVRTMLRLFEPSDGGVYFEGQPLHEFGSSEIRSLRRKMQMIFQDPQSSLNPRRTVGQTVGRAMEKHDIVTGEEKRERVGDLLERVGLSRAAASKHLHEFSGGQQQHVAIAHALAVEPKLTVRDEPMLVLDVSAQAQILNLLNEIQDDENISFLFISHNIGVTRHICDRVAVMYLGKIAEFGRIEQVFSPSFHPYTESLLSAVPHANPDRETDRILFEESAPGLINPSPGCPFQTHCSKKIGDVCEQDFPELEAVDGGNHYIFCHLSDGEINQRDSSITPSKRAETSPAGSD